MAEDTRINTYPLTGPQGPSHQTHALQRLHSHLPTSLPLYRRLQAGRFHAKTSFVLSNVNLDFSNSDPDSNPNSKSNGQTETEDSENDGRPWIIVFLDRSCRPETEAWWYGSYEAFPPSTFAIEAWRTIDSLVQRTVATIKELPLPPSIHQDFLDSSATTTQDDTANDTDAVGNSRNDYAGHMLDSNIMLWGAVHETTTKILSGLGLVSSQFKSGLVGNHAFIFDLADLPPARELPEGLYWGDAVRPQDFALVKSRTQIPRQDRTMATLPSLTIYSRGQEAPISWAFVGVDGSLTTLHVEPEWRGKGLAKAITTKLFTEKMTGFWTEGKAKQAHGYVIVGNVASQKMCESLGGKSGWECYWLRVDLGKA